MKNLKRLQHCLLYIISLEGEKLQTMRSLRQSEQGKCFSSTGAKTEIYCTEMKTKAGNSVYQCRDVSVKS